MKVEAALGRLNSPLSSDNILDGYRNAGVAMAMEEGRRGLQNVLLGAHESFHMSCPQDARQDGTC